MDFAFKTQPFAHQLRIWSETKDRDYHGLFMEMGTGKTWVAINTAAWKYLNQGCEGLLVIAPNGVHQNWIHEEIPKHWPDAVAWHGVAYYSSKARSKKQQKAVEEVLETDYMAVLSMSYDALNTEAGRATAERFLKERANCMMVCDESARIKTPSAKRTQAIVSMRGNSGLASLAKFRWALTGTPVANGPFDVFSQIKFLNHQFWSQYGLSPFSVFKRVFGIFESRPFAKWGVCVGYQNLDRLHGLVDQVSTRLTKEDCLDLPPKLYQKMFFDLPPGTQETYDALKNDYMVELEGGAEITAPLAIVRLTRLQQITCGFIAIDGEDEVQPLEKNPRLELLKEICEDVDSAIIWARYTKDIDNIVAALGSEKCAVIDGRVSDHSRKEQIDRFQGGLVPFFVGNPAAISEGVTLHRTSTVIYYSNSFKLAERLQSEDRAHRIGQTRNVTIIDLVARGTVDERIVAALRDKQNVASAVTGDNLREWI
jgi:SNF2 family DNA or RNA helicase